MKPFSILTLGFVTMLLNGCVSIPISSVAGSDFTASSAVYETNSDSKQQLLETLINSCDLDQNSRLAAADSVMEQIVKLTVDANGKVIKQSNPDLQLAGNRLLTFTKQVYTNNPTPESCRKSAEAVAYFVYLSKVDLDALKNNQRVLTTSR